MYVTRHSNVTDPLVLDELWALYAAGYAELSSSEVTREALYRFEFDEVMADPTYRTYVVREDNDPVAMATVATEIGATRYLSRAYFEEREPVRMAQGLVHYVMWVVTHPDHQGGRATFELSRGAFAQESAERALLVFDLPETNQPNQHGGGAELIYRMAQMVGPVSLEAHGGSRYYALDFAQVDADAATEPLGGAPTEAVPAIR